MRIEPEGNRFIIVRSRGSRESCFDFFVDGDSSSWALRRFGRRCEFGTREQAEEALAELRRRAAAKRRRG